jgi:hypothetical protein
MFGRTTIEDMKKVLEGVTDVRENTLRVDIIDILDALEPYEVTDKTIWDKEEEIDYEYYIDDYLMTGLEEGWIEEGIANNTYNWSAPLTNDINFETYHDKPEDEYIVRFRIHCGVGDIRSGYSEWMYLSFSYEEEFLELFLECCKCIEVKLEGEVYYLEINPLSDDLTLTKGETYEVICGTNKYDLLDKMEELNLITY